MTVAAAVVFALPDAPWVSGALTGRQMAVVGLLAAALLRYSRWRVRWPMFFRRKSGSPHQRWPGDQHERMHTAQRSSEYYDPP